MKKSEYLEKYGFEIPFTDSQLSIVGTDVEFLKGNKNKIIKQGIVTDLKFGDSVVVKNGKKYLTVSFAIGDWWSRDFPTEILAPFIYSDHTDNMIKKSISVLKDNL